MPSTNNTAIESVDRSAIPAWVNLAYIVFVIVWGALVRATDSGAGCGNHWPLCNGEFVPSVEGATAIEFIHRVSSGLCIPLALATVAYYWRYIWLRRTGVMMIALLCLEALIGAVLVKAELVAGNASLSRAIVMAFHLVNTFLLLGVVTRYVQWISVGKPRQTNMIPSIAKITVLGMILVGASGGVAALGDTLFPATSLADGLAQELAPNANTILKLRILHPVMALTVFCLLLATGLQAKYASMPTSNWVLGLACLQVFLGITNWALLAPIWMQLIHLLCADALWCALIWLVGDWQRSPTREHA